VYLVRYNISSVVFINTTAALFRFYFFLPISLLGKSTLLSALSGRLVPTEGTRTEGDGLELGVFTQDLAQDLDQDSIATDIVTLKVRQKDPTISDETARRALGALGLTGEKSLRKVGHLSGGEKARVALASFVLIPHNLLLLDEPSNHLDVTTLKVVTHLAWIGQSVHGYLFDINK
jgi:ATPase subunit of ABC transporter with duplicated ATPase domains